MSFCCGIQQHSQEICTDWAYVLTLHILAFSLVKESEDMGWQSQCRKKSFMHHAPLGGGGGGDMDVVKL